MLPAEPTREEVDASSGFVVLEFGAGWCGICQAAQPLIERALAARSDLQHLKIEDGRGKRLGRSFGVKLWPTLVFLEDGREVARIVRPRGDHELAEALAKLPRAGS
ncbi:MAG: thioredoxin family protein [Deltaproteobacteria bacterium]|nr:thioredoxin family protein [Deltaproteobacteria bacterium]